MENIPKRYAYNVFHFSDIRLKMNDSESPSKEVTPKMKFR